MTANDSLVVAFELTTSDREAVVTEVTAGKFREVPVAFVVYYLGRVTVTDGRGGSVGLNWSAPTVRRAGSQVTMAIEGRSSATDGPVQIRTVWMGCPDKDCATRVVASTSKKITAIDPPRGATEQTASSLELQSQSPGVTLTFEDGTAPEPFISWNLPAAVWSTLESLWRQTMLFGPWLIAALWYRSRTPAAITLTPSSGIAEAFRHLLIAAIVIAGVMSVNLLQFAVPPLLEWFRSIRLDWIPNGNPVSVPAIVALLALWTWRWQREPQAGSRTWSITWKFGILLLGLAAIVLAAYWLFVGAGPGYAPGLPNSGWVVAGAAFAVTGAIQVSLAMRRAREGTIDGLCAASLILILALSSTLYSRNSAVISGILTLIVLVAFVNTLIWVILTAAGAQIEGRPRRWLQAGILLFSLTFAVAARIPSYTQFPVSPYDALTVSFNTEPFLRIGLILALVAVLRHLAQRSHPDAVWRMIAVASVALLLLRPEKMLVGIPISFLVAIVLTLHVLVEPQNEVRNRALHQDVPAEAGTSTGY
ncbi:hypothetical protein J2809_004210 [Arthrobacter pascens]|uniref:hypothetical protein n=1 Tax=Arthrobacter pascens TaxID=1677 RepID=UPI0028676809|nr:hypothetical protein [Arthrobacter pascens]MDR6559827.1 hypothetical protein [Arthrobacter pascens]